ncbi:MAG: RNA 3'-phosphate cyclase [Crenarchaeota archaeon]|nr:MAG: RNA 3'-phosphate cyclase [Thermoproteota archaeon]RDJ34491.1 MAG: RNA 3'-phosphate cyclase [Thermoproteota archaeon]RDJ34830.1 MAG: RNA 3'-phosphate cyclase [Thermoproteota archaeon]RDJ38567.1 MAG: RNA 3'-phosphate cyclase [Thermoproteota archaeon]
MDFFEIDGSYGEGGGQILRSSISLSCITQKPIQINNIRAKRKTPGLSAQHLTSIRILAKICNAEVHGLEIGSTCIKFVPGLIQDQKIIENVGTAGSISLIAQVLIPVVSISRKNLELNIKGGTDVSWSPTIDYTKIVLQEAYRRFGISFSLDVEQRGYYPKGNGIVRLNVLPANKLSTVSFTKREIKEADIHCTYSKIPSSIIETEVNKISRNLEKANFVTQLKIRNEDALDKGASILISSKDSKSIIGIDELLNVKNFRFSDIAQNFIECNLGVDSHLADMIVIPAALADGISVFRINTITKHLETNLYVTSKITGCKYGIGRIDGGFEIRIEGISCSRI